MSGMDAYLAEYFGNAPASSGPSGEDFEKAAQVELFQKLASDNGIDLDTLNDNQLTQLWNATFEKSAEESAEEERAEKKERAGLEQAKKGLDKAREGDDEEKKAYAAAELAMIQDGQAKFAEASDMGKIMAHSYVAELRKIAEDEQAKEAAKKPGMFARAGKYLKGVATGEHVEKSRESGKSGLSYLKERRHAQLNPNSKRTENFRRARDEMSGGATKKEMRNMAAKAVATHAGHQVAHHGLTKAAPAAAIAGGAYAAGRSKESSALDELAGEAALNKVAAAGWDPEEAGERLDAVLTLGMDLSEKIASAADVDSAVEVRSLELLEAAGYPVTWSE